MDLDTGLIIDCRMAALLKKVAADTGMRSIAYLDRGTFSYIFQGIVGREQFVLKLSASLNDQAVCLPVHVLREVQALTNLRHPNVVPLLRLHIVPGVVCMQLPRYDCNLFNYLRYARPLSLFVIRHIFKAVAGAVCAAHSAGIMHRDIKAGNILMGDSARTVVLADWGMSRSSTHQSGTFLTGLVYTLWYAPPEVLCNQTDYSYSADVWSLGILLLELMSGGSVFKITEHRETFLTKVFQLLGNRPMSERTAAWFDARLPKQYHSMAICTKYESRVRPMLCNRKDILTSQCMDLLEAMLCYIPEDRITAAAIMEHPFIKHTMPPEPLPTSFRSSPKHVARYSKCAYFPPDQMLNVQLRVHAPELVPVIQRLGWHPVCTKDQVLRMVKFVADHFKVAVESYLVAMLMSWQVFDGAEEAVACDIPKSMYACISLAYSTLAPCQMMEHVRDTSFPDFHCKQLLGFGYTSVTDLAITENRVLALVHGQVPLPPVIYKVLSGLDMRAQRLAMLLLTFPEFLEKNDMTILTVRDVCTDTSHALTPKCLKFAEDCKFVLYMP
jgi:serine/threonine protein kinase